MDMRKKKLKAKINYLENLLQEHEERIDKFKNDMFEKDLGTVHEILGKWGNISIERNLVIQNGYSDQYDEFIIRLLK